MTLNRRQMLRAAGAAAALGLGPLGLSRLQAQDGKTKRVLFFTKSSGFQHSVIDRKGKDDLAHAEKILTDLGKEHGFEVTCSKDGRLFDPDKIGDWDVFAFYTTGDLTQEGPHKDGQPMSAEGKAAFLQAIKEGKGFIGFHCATDTFHSKGSELDPYIQMIGGEFYGHGPQQEATIKIADPRFPGVGAFGSGSFKLNDEWYGLKNFAPDLHVILIQETEGMKGDDYNRPAYPETWARMHGKGRVFYTSMGHREDVWTNEKFQALVIGGLGWAAGKADFDAESNVKKVTPEYEKSPK